MKYCELCLIRLESDTEPATFLIGVGLPTDPECPDCREDVTKAGVAYEGVINVYTCVRHLASANAKQHCPHGRTMNFSEPISVMS